MESAIIHFVLLSFRVQVLYMLLHHHSLLGCLKIQTFSCYDQTKKYFEKAYCAVISMMS